MARFGRLESDIHGVDLSGFDMKCDQGHWGVMITEVTNFSIRLSFGGPRWKPYVTGGSVETVKMSFDFLF